MSRFNYGDDNGNITDGSTDGYFNSLKLNSLTAGLPVKVSVTRELISEKILLSDIDFDVLTNPYVGTLQVTDLETDNYFSLETELQKINNFEASTATDTNISGRVRVGEIASSRIYDPTIATYIELDGSTVEVSANDLTVNGFSVIKSSDTAGKLTVGNLQTSTTLSLNNELSKLVNVLQPISGTTILSGNLQINGDQIVLTDQGGANIGNSLTTNQVFFFDNQSLITKKYVDDALQSNSTNGTVQNANLSLQPKNTGSIVGNARANNSVDLQLQRDQNNQIASGQNSCIIAGALNTCSGQFSSIISGDRNVVSGIFSNCIGQNNNVGGSHNTLSGFGNVLTGSYNDCSGYNNIISGNDSSCSGRLNNLNALAINSTVSGLSNNLTTGYSQVSGSGNILNGNGYSSVSGLNNNSSSAYSLISGQDHIGSASHCIVSGQSNSVNGIYSNVSGQGNFVNAPHTIVAGQGNSINSSGLYSIAMGKDNFINGAHSVCMGESNIAQGSNSVALGKSSNAANDGTFIFADKSSESGYSSSDANTFNIRASNGFNLDSINSDSKINFKIDGVSKSSIVCPITGENDLVISTTGKDIRLFSKFGKVNTNCDLKLGSYDYSYANVNFRSDSNKITNGSNPNCTYGHSFICKVGISINTLLIPSDLLSNNGGSQPRNVSIWTNGVLTRDFIFPAKTSIDSVNGFYSSELAVPFICISGETYIIACATKGTDLIDDSSINNGAVITGSNISDLDDLFSNVVGLFNPSQNTNGTRLPATLTTGLVPYIQFNFSTNTVGKDIKSQNIVCDQITVGNPIIESESKIISTIDYSNLYPKLMLADITVNGGINKCWGRTALYKAGADLLAGRIVSLQDTGRGDDNEDYLTVVYLKNGEEDEASISPLGVTQNNVLAGENVLLCLSGYTTVISENSAFSPKRGSQIISDTGNIGKVRINNLGGNNQARLGYVAQSNSVGTNGPVLIYYSGYFQPY
jgi:hypothetical protein